MCANTRQMAAARWERYTKNNSRSFFYYYFLFVFALYCQRVAFQAGFYSLYRIKWRRLNQKWSCSSSSFSYLSRVNANHLICDGRCLYVFLSTDTRKIFPYEDCLLDWFCLSLCSTEYLWTLPLWLCVVICAPHSNIWYDQQCSFESTTQSARALVRY